MSYFPSISAFTLLLGADSLRSGPACFGKPRIFGDGRQLFIYLYIKTAIYVTHVSILTPDTSAIHTCHHVASPAYRTFCYHTEKSLHVRDFGL